MKFALKTAICVPSYSSAVLYNSRIGYITRSYHPSNATYVSWASDASSISRTSGASAPSWTSEVSRASDASDASGGTSYFDSSRVTWASRPSSE